MNEAIEKQIPKPLLDKIILEHQREIARTRLAFEIVSNQDDFETKKERDLAEKYFVLGRFSK